MFKPAAILLFVACLMEGRAQELRFNWVTNQSRSGLFTVAGAKIPTKTLFFNNFAGDQPLKLDPALLAVSCEQIKELLFRELGYNVRQQLIGAKDNLGLSKIFIVLHSQPDEPIAFSAVPARGGVSFRVDLPNEMFSSRMIETIVQILLIDMANVKTHSVEASPPVWLTKGLVAHLQSVGLQTLPLEANLPVTKVTLRKESVAAVREHLHERAPLTFDELSWPEKLTNDRLSVFEDSAQLFVYELLRLKDGKPCLRQMINTLPNYKNWQFAFFDAFAPRFSQTVDVEKWWALSIVSFTGRDQQVWSREESEKKLAAALKVPAHVYSSPNAMPRHTEVTFQQIIQDWDFTRQQVTLHKVIAQLRILRVRISPDLLSAVDNYRAVLENYLQDRSPSEMQKKNSAGVNAIKRAACVKLDELDRLYPRKKLPAPPVATATLSSASAK